MPWECDRCRQVITTNAKECPNCGHGVFAPISRDELPDSNADGPDPIDLNDPSRRAGTATPEAEYSSGPDVAPDGSVAGSRPDGWLARLKSLLPGN